MKHLPAFVSYEPRNCVQNHPETDCAVCDEFEASFSQTAEEAHLFQHMTFIRIPAPDIERPHGDFPEKQPVPEYPQRKLCPPSAAEPRPDSAAR